MEPSHKSDDNRDKAVAGRNVRLQLADGGEDLDGTGKPGKST